MNSIEFASRPPGDAIGGKANNADSAPGSTPKDAAAHMHMSVRRGSFALARSAPSRQALEAAASEEAASSKSGEGSARTQTPPPHAHFDKELLTAACDVLQRRSMMISRKSLQVTRSGANLAGVEQEAAPKTGSNP